MALVIPWLLVREYQQHRNLDYYGLPETFEEWREAATALADQLARVTGRRIVKVLTTLANSKSGRGGQGTSSERSGALRIREDGLGVPKPPPEAVPMQP